MCRRKAPVPRVHTRLPLGTWNLPATASTAAAAESGRLGSLREGGEQGTGAVPQNWPAGLRAGLAQKPGVVSVPQLARSDPARAANRGSDCKL